MLGQAILVKLLDYNTDSNERIFALAAQLDDAQLHAPTTLGHGSLHQTIFHLVRVQMAWSEGVLERESGAAFALRAEDYPTVAEIVVLWHTGNDELRVFLAGLNEDDLTKQITRRRPDGAQFTFPRWHMLIQIIMHSMQHRTELAAMLTSYGHSPGDIDFVFFAMRG